MMEKTDLELLQELVEARNIDTGYALVCAALAICQELQAIRAALEKEGDQTMGWLVPTRSS